LWPEWLAYGHIATLAVHTTTAAITLTGDLIARTTTGRPMPGEEAGGPPQSVLLLADEAGTGRYRDALQVAGADLVRVSIPAVREGGAEFDLCDLERVVADSASRLVVIDPLSAYWRGGREVLDGLCALAKRQQAAVLLVTEASGQARKRVAELRDATAVQLLFARTPGGTGAAVLACRQSRLGSAPQSLACHAEVDRGVLRLAWDGPATVDHDELLTAGKIGQKGTAAVNFLLRALQHGPVAEREIKELSATAGISAATLRRAKDQLGVRSIKRHGAWDWSLPGANLPRLVEALPAPPNG
jgi:hypothetical protein